MSDVRKGRVLTPLRRKAVPRTSGFSGMGKPLMISAGEPAISPTPVPTGKQGGRVRRSRTFAAACGSGKNKTPKGFCLPPSRLWKKLTRRQPNFPALIICKLPSASKPPLREGAFLWYRVNPRPQLFIIHYSLFIIHLGAPHRITLPSTH